jgi:hypothetical protein
VEVQGRLDECALQVEAQLNSKAGSSCTIAIVADFFPAKSSLRFPSQLFIF